MNAAALAKIQGDIARHRVLFNLVRDGLGKSLCSTATDGIQACIDGHHEPDGTPWLDLSPDYEEWKSFHYPGQPIGKLHDLMSDPAEVAGDVIVFDDEALVTYGITQQARDEAEWFQKGHGTQPPRPFWGFTEASLGEVRNLLDARFATA